MLGHYRTLLEGVVADPGRRISELPMLSAGERRRLLEWNRTETDYPRDETVVGLFGAQALASPDAVAVDYGGETLSYAELNARANRLAHYLRSRGVGPEVMVGVYLERGLEMLVGLLGILKAGGAYVPLDLDYPPSRIRFMLEDAEVPVLLSHSGLSDRLPAFAGELVCVDSDWPLIERESAANPASGATADSLAYVIYTSGSTGTPKGVEIAHRAINRLVRNTDYYQVEPGDRIAQASNVSFDAATFEIWGALLNGARLVGIDKEVLLNSKSLASFLQAQEITAMFLTTALFNQVAREAPGAFEGLRGLMFGGEAVDPGSVRKVLQNNPPERLLHVYGPTESTTFASWYRVEEVPADAVTVPIGRPLANTRLYVLDKHLNPVPVGVPGELYIGGDGLARGYLKRPELTGERFIADPFDEDPATRLYKTGDQVRYRADGALEYLGRFDHQVKLRGFRVEPGEIESVLVAQPAVSEAVVIVHAEEGGDKRLVAYVAAAGDEAPSESELREQVAQRLPSYMVPSAFVVLEKLPLTANGKVDRDALPGPDAMRSEGEGYTAPRSEVEAQLAQIWAEVLKLEKVGVHDNFFDLGGHSLMATQAVSRIREQLDVELPLSEMFDYPTVAELAQKIELIYWANQEFRGDEIEEREVLSI
jgi:amino acid adenylation domain-containing protein